MSKRAIDLSQFDDEFRSEQPEERGDFESVPDGKYQVTVEKVELVEAQSSGNPMLKCELSASLHETCRAWMVGSLCRRSAGGKEWRNDPRQELSRSRHRRTAFPF